MLNVSLSAVQAFRRCPQQYKYQYVDGLQKRSAAPPVELGKIVHHYLERYYGQLQRGSSAADAHSHALMTMQTKYEGYLQGLTNVALMMGADDDALALSTMLEKATRLCERYHTLRGQGDAEAFEVLSVERRLSAAVSPSIVSNGVVDMLTRERDSGRVHLWEHKTTTSVPSPGYRLRDLQTVLYAAKLRGQEISVNAVWWNYIRTKEPQVPSILKSGAVSRAACDTTWPVYERAVLDAKQNLDDYADMRVKLLSRELETFYPRFEHIILAEESILLRDYITTAHEIERKRYLWEQGAEAPVRVLTRDCDQKGSACPYLPLCTAVLTGGDDDSLIAYQYTTREQRK